MSIDPMGRKYYDADMAGIAVGRLREQREQRALSQADLSTASGVAAATISRLETGRQRAYPTTVRKLAAALGVAPAALYRGPEDGHEEAR